jgi:uncharacterized membrane protein YhaH (DUF805 family)
MSFGDAISTCFNKYAEFVGRARRSEYWWFFLFVLLVDVVVSRLSFTLSMVASLALLVPNLAVGVRRLHDTGKSGWYLLVGLIPIVGWIIVIVWLATEGDPNPNEYGESPKAALI